MYEKFEGKGVRLIKLEGIQKALHGECGMQRIWYRSYSFEGESAYQARTVH